MDIDRATKVNQASTIDQSIAELYRDIDKLEQQLKSNLNRYKQAIENEEINVENQHSTRP